MAVPIWLNKKWRPEKQVRSNEVQLPHFCMRYEVRELVVMFYLHFWNEHMRNERHDNHRFSALGHWKKSNVQPYIIASFAYVQQNTSSCTAIYTQAHPDMRLFSQISTTVIRINRVEIIRIQWDSISIRTDIGTYDSLKTY